MTSKEIKNFAILFTSFLLLVLSIMVLLEVNKKDEAPPMSKQNVVCDLVYGVQYFEHDGSLTVRLNHEGVPIRCFE